MHEEHSAFGRRDFLTTTFVGTAAALVLPSAIEGSPSYAQAPASSVPAGVNGGTVPVTLNLAENPEGSVIVDDTRPVPDAGTHAPDAGTEHVHVAFVSRGVVPVVVTSAPAAVLGPLFVTMI